MQLIALAVFFAGEKGKEDRIRAVAVTLVAIAAGILPVINSRHPALNDNLPEVADDIFKFLREIGAPTMARAIAFTRVQKHYRNNVNRVVNAEMANQTRSSNAAADQLALIEKAEKLIGLRALPPAVRDFCLARKDNPELSLSALGESFVPPVSKSAMYHRLLRLEKIVQDLEKDA